VNEEERKKKNKNKEKKRREKVGRCLGFKLKGKVG
jgi:hypothetical protein